MVTRKSMITFLAVLLMSFELLQHPVFAQSRDDPSDAAFHETAASDLRELIGLTRELEVQMVFAPCVHQGMG